MGRKSREGPPPWITAGMSRASWYRYGKPDSKPLPPRHRWFTQTGWAQVLSRSIKPAPGLSVRSIQRWLRIQREAPDLAEQVKAAALTLGVAERMLIVRQDAANDAAARKRRNGQARRLL